LGKFLIFVEQTKKHNMKFKITESLFEDGTPHIEIVEGITINDVVVTRRNHSKDAEVVIDGDDYDRKISISLYVTPTEELENELIKYIPDNRSLNKENMYKWIFKSPEFGTNPKPNVQKDWSIIPKFNGLKTRESKIDRYNELLDQFISDFNRDEKMVSVLKDINDSLERAVEHFNRRYNDDIKGLFERTSSYESFWNPKFENDSECKDSMAELAEIHTQLTQLKQKLKEANKKLQSDKNRIVLKEIESHVIEDGLKRDIVENITSENTKANNPGSIFDLLG
jgi:hypothetical protein